MFNHQTKTITFAAFLLALSGLISRFLGLARDRLLAGHFGAGEQLDIYFAAFRIPDFVYGILIAGGITAVFLPVFSEYFFKKAEAGEIRKEGEWPTSALEFTNNILNSFLIMLVLICGVLAIFTPYIIHLVIPGFSPADKSLTIALTRIMFLSPVLFGVSSIFSGVLQYFNRFLVYALTPILYNLGIIFGILFLVPAFGVYGLAYGVILGALMHLAIQIPAALKTGFKYKAILDFRHSGLLKILKLTIPRLVGTAANQINLVVITALASVLAAGSISIFNFSNNIQYFPIGIIGISFAVSSFPVFSRYLANGQKKEFLHHFSSAFRQILFFLIPASFLIFVLRAQLVRVILGTGHFDWQATRLTAACLGIFCLSILAESLVQLLSRAFFALQDTKTPVLVGLLSVAANIILCVLFIFLLGFQNSFHNFLVDILHLQNIQHIEVIAFPLGVSLSALLQMALLLVFLFRKIGDFGFKEIISTSVKAVFASVFLTASAYLALNFLVEANLVSTTTFWGIFLQAAIAGSLGLGAYVATAYLLKMPEVKTIKGAIFRQFFKNPKI